MAAILYRATVNYLTTGIDRGFTTLLSSPNELSRYRIFQMESIFNILCNSLHSKYYEGFTSPPRNYNLDFNINHTAYPFPWAHTIHELSTVFMHYISIFMHEIAYADKAWKMLSSPQKVHRLTHWGRVTHLCVSKLTIIGSDNGFSPGRRQASIWTNAKILLIQRNRNRNSYIFIQESAILSRP